jgi:hypothetical protein
MTKRDKEMNDDEIKSDNKMGTIDTDCACRMGTAS